MTPPTVNVASSDVVHGKPSTYNRHRCRCEACRQAATDYRRRMRRASATARERDRLKSAALAETFRKLRANHPDEFARIYYAERLAVGLPVPDPDAALIARLEIEATPPLGQLTSELADLGIDPT